MRETRHFEIPTRDRPPAVPDRLADAAPLSDVEPIHLIGSLDLDHIEAERVIEQPLQAACQELWDKNVTTTLSSANRYDLQRGVGTLYIEYGFLSPENRQVAESLGTIRGISDVATQTTRWVAIIEFPVDWMDTVASVRERSLAIAKQFRDQPGRYPSEE